MKRLELGDDYQSSDTEQSVKDGEEDITDSYYDEDNTNDNKILLNIDESKEFSNDNDTKSVVQQQMNTAGTEIASPLPITPASIAQGSQQHLINVDQMGFIDEKFNPLRFLALHLRELGSQLRTISLQNGKTINECLFEKQ